MKIILVKTLIDHWYDLKKNLFHIPQLFVLLIKISDLEHLNKLLVTVSLFICKTLKSKFRIQHIPSFLTSKARQPFIVSFYSSIS